METNSCLYFQVHVIVDVPLKPCPIAVTVAVSVPVPQVKLQVTVAEFRTKAPGAMHALLVVH